MKISTSKTFDALMNEAMAPNSQSTNFKFDKMLQANTSRKENRKLASGAAYFYDESGDLLGKSELADVSASGARVKTSELKVQPGSFVTVIIVSAGTQFEQVVCKIRWIADIDVRLQCKQMGVEFATITPAFKEQFTRKMALR